ncbi:MAG: hypothetical protein JOZ15_11470, partial [Acidobacteria bacterium]|nr:hypothetical protein [Acidobacteriota bacterium]
MSARRPKLKRVGVVAKRTSQETAETAGELAEWLRRRDLEVLLDGATLQALGRQE